MDIFCQPFTPPKVIPLTKYFWKKKKITYMGNATKVAPAIAIPISINSPGIAEILAIAIGSVLILSLVIIIKGHKKLFHEPQKVKIVKQATRGFEIGKTIERKILNSFAPSIRAISKSSEGMVLIYCLAKNIAPAPAAIGRKIPGYVLINPKDFINKYLGIRVTWIGIIIVMSIIQKKIFFPGNSFLAKVYPDRHEQTTTRRVVPPATIILFIYHLRTG